MKKIQMGSVEILGFVGIVVWVAVNILRLFHLGNHPAYLLILGITPNVGAAWALTMLCKWMVQWRCGGSYTVLAHMIICVMILLAALISEFFHDLFLAAPFDVYDMVATLLAQIAIMCVPIALKDSSFELDES